MALMELLVYQCGMRRPSLGQNGGDLSRLTSASSDTESSNNLQTVVVTHVGALHPKTNIDRTVTTTSPTKLSSPTYLTDLLDTTEWLKSSRKRKERQDSTSSTTQDRKLVRSNSEEFISQNYEDYDGLRRVSSHEDFKKRNNSTSSSSSSSTTGSTSSNDDDDDNGEEDDEPQNDENLMPNSNHTAEPHPILNYVECSNKLIGEHVKEKSPNFAQKYRLSPVRDIKNKNDDNIDGADHERQRQNERFSKMRATPGRKAISPRKSSKHSNSIKMMRDKDENCYKYDISALKYERRGFVSSKHKFREHTDHQYQQKQQDEDQKENEPKDDIPLNEDAVDVSDYNDNNLKEAQNKSPHFIVTKQEDLPWSKSFQNDTPIVCPRFADNTYDHVNNSQDKPAKFYTPIILPAKDTKSDSVPIQSKISRDTMKTPASLYLTAEEKIKTINKRLILLKKRYSQYEEKFELSHGHKPSQNDKTSDKIIKNLVSEMSKLRREKHHLKQEPRNYYNNNNNNNTSSNNNYYKVEDDMISEELREEAKLTKMKETLMEIEKRLQKKRVEESRSVELETLTPDELIKEKTAVQKGLLYLESLFGRPVTRDERDAARPLYDRYRIIKRLVNRNAMLSGSGISVPELPTILEHEAMAFTCTTTSSSNDRTSLSIVSIGESDTSDSVQSTTDSTDTSSSMTENVHIMSIQELWKQMDGTREETKTLKKTIKEFEEIFEERNGRKMLKADRKLIEETYSLYKQKKAKLRLLDALIKKQMSTF